MDSHVPGSKIGSWTNEKHVHYLNSMEAAFVRTMFETKDCHLRLDRYIPDSFESTLDLKSRRQKKHTTSEIIGSKAEMDARSDKRSRRRQHSASQDQVVPQLENRTGDKDERDPSNAPVTSARGS
ncbi:hypothetical protein CFOL_v3_15990 [Cephalotus follicularis]|uniref:Uncharacterized protein n=1 Tax=Cephalotus follicularis TaxID=3775 RepID=A0A1Q3BXA4_CEPFO|nr:hypothetical protein CFOL_v3_15990 [Cephalotus follicularis]